MTSGERLQRLSRSLAIGERARHRLLVQHRLRLGGPEVVLPPPDLVGVILAGAAGVADQPQLLGGDARPSPVVEHQVVHGPARDDALLSAPVLRDTVHLGDELGPGRPPRAPAVPEYPPPDPPYSFAGSSITLPAFILGCWPCGTRPLGNLCSADARSPSIPPRHPVRRHDRRRMQPDHRVSGRGRKCWMQQERVSWIADHIVPTRRDRPRVRHRRAGNGAGHRDVARVELPRLQHVERGTTFSTGLAVRALADGFVAVFPRGSDFGGTTPAYFNLETVDDPSLADDVEFTAEIPRSCRGRTVHRPEEDLPCRGSPTEACSRPRSDVPWVIGSPPSLPWPGSTYCPTAVGIRCR